MIVLIGHDLGNNIIKHAVMVAKSGGVGRSVEDRSILPSIYGVIDDNWSDVYSSSNIKRTLWNTTAQSYRLKDFDVDISGIKPRKRFKETFCEITLPACQWACVTVIENYRLSSETNEAGFSKTDPGSMLWACYLFDKYLSAFSSKLNLTSTCRNNIPFSLLYPSLTLFIYTTLGFIILSTIIYKQHQHHRHQYHFLLTGLLTGSLTSIYLLSQHTPLNPLTSIIFISIILALLLSAATPSVLSFFFPNDE